MLRSKVVLELFNITHIGLHINLGNPTTTVGQAIAVCVNIASAVADTAASIRRGVVLTRTTVSNLSIS